MSPPQIPSQQRASIVSFTSNKATSEANIEAKPNQGTRKGFHVVVVSYIAKGVKGLTKFFKKNSQQAARSAASSMPAAPAAKRVSIESTVKSFSEECRQYLQEAKEHRSALPDAEQFNPWADAFTKNYDEIFSRTFRDPLPGTPVGKELKTAERKTLLTIWEGLDQERNEGKDCMERATYMLFVCGDGAPEYAWLAELPKLRTLGAQNKDTQPQAPQLPESSAPQLSETEKQALHATFEGIVPDWTAEAAPAPAAIETLPAGQAEPEKHIIERIYRTNVSARKMLISPKHGTTTESRKSFDAFSSRFDEIHRASFKEQFEHFRSRNYSASQAAGMAAQTALSSAALTLRDKAAVTGNDAEYQYAQDMLNKEAKINKLAIRLLKGPAKVKTALARIATRKNAANKNASPVLDDLISAGKRTRMIFDRARKICVVGKQAPKSFAATFGDAFDAHFKADVKALQDLEMTSDKMKKLSKSWRHDIAYDAALKAIISLMATMKAGNDPDQRAYAQELWDVRETFEAKIKDLFYATRLLSIKDARDFLLKTTA